MRSVSGFERPAVQWLFVALSIALIATAGGAAWAARRASAAAEAVRAAEESGRAERQQLEARLARERSAREALTLELTRVRESGGPARLMPTLTLTPIARRGATPPEPTVAAQHATQIIELRLVLPGAAKAFRRFDVVLREWSSGNFVWSRGGLPASTVDRQSIVTAFATGDLLRPGAYELLVSGVAPDGRKTEVASYEISLK